MSSVRHEIEKSVLFCTDTRNAGTEGTSILYWT